MQKGPLRILPRSDDPDPAAPRRVSRAPARDALALLVEQNDALERQRAAAVDWAKQIATLARLIAAGDSPIAVCQVASDTALALTQAQWVGIMLPGQDGLLRYVVQSGRDDTRINEYRFAPGEGFVGRTFAEGHAYRVHDLYAEARSHRPDLDRELGSRAFLAVPLVAKDQVIGVLGASSDVPGRFTADHEEQLQQLADQAALALHKAWLLEAERTARLALAETEAQLRTVYDVIACGVILQDAAGAVLRGNAAAEDILGWPVGERLPLQPAGPWQLTPEGGEIEASPAALVMQTGQPVRSVTLSVKRPDGDVRWLQVDAVPVWDDEGGLVQTVTSFVDVTRRRHAEDALQHQARHDALTGLPNRAVLDDRLQQGIHTARRERQSLALLVMDLDRFKEVNDTLGHQQGDLLLQQVARRLRDGVRTSDTVARLGGDEFAVLLPHVDEVGAVKVARTLLNLLEQPVTLRGRTVGIGASIGIARFPEDGDDPETLLRRADVAMYVAKRGHSGYSVYSPDLDVHTPDRLVLLNELREAVAADGLALHFQPRVRLDSGAVVGVEALVRWPHPTRGLVPPDAFVPLAEQSGLIGPLTEWVLRSALRQSARWHDAGLALPVAVNLSMHDLHDPTLPDRVAALLRDHGLPPGALTVEVTESTIMANPAQALDVLARLDRMGIHAAIDDFGTGYSSLGYLKELPIRELKIDRAFVRDMAADPGTRAIVRSTIDLGHNLGLKVVAEGVEDQRALAMLTGFGCDLAQGFLLAEPLPTDALEAWLAARAATA